MTKIEWWHVKVCNEKNGIKKIFFCKNPAYGRESISRPMWMVASTPKNPAKNDNKANIMLIMLTIMLKMLNWLNDKWLIKPKLAK